MDRIEPPPPDALKIIFHFYPEETPLRQMLLKHSRQVGRKAVWILNQCRDRIPVNLNPASVEAGALLHDIGIGRCHAPDIFCTGTVPYIAHGIIGAEMLRSYGAEQGLNLEKYARICERHTGTGLTADDIRRQNLPLPEQDYLPETDEEKLICLADKFYSKSGDMREKEMSRILRSMQKFGSDAVARWCELCRKFGLEPLS